MAWASAANQIDRYDLVAANQDLLNSVINTVQHLGQLEQKSMFGGVGLMWNGYLLCAVSGDGILVRLTADDFAAMNGQDGSGPMITGRRISKHWLRVPAASLTTEQVLTKWLAHSEHCVRQLPPK